jgi:hypothetical protein
VVTEYKNTSSIYASQGILNLNHKGGSASGVRGKLRKPKVFICIKMYIFDA